MKTKSFGRYTYFVTKYTRTEKGEMTCVTRQWITKEIAFKDAQRHENKHGKGTAFVHRARRCIEIE